MADRQCHQQARSCNVYSGNRVFYVPAIKKTMLRKTILPTLLIMLIPAIASSTPTTSITTYDKATPLVAFKDIVMPLRTIDPSDHHFNDLAAFGDAVGNARYVVLGEKSHGEGNVFSLKVRLVEYLHEKLGFDVVAMESGIYEGAKISQLRQRGTPLRELAKGNLFFMYAGSAQITPLFNYLDRHQQSPHPLAFTTFDSQQSGGLSQQSMMIDLAAELMRRQSSIPRDPAWRVFAARCNALFRLERSVPPAAEQQRFFAMLKHIDAVLADDPEQETDFPSGAGFWRRIIASIGAQAESLWIEGNQLVNHPREREMAANMAWILQHHYAGKKVVIWTHDFHGQKSSLIAGEEGMMARLRHTMPTDDFYHVYFTGHHGKYVDFNNGKQIDIHPPLAGSIEAWLHQAGIKQGYVDIKTVKNAGIDIEKMGVSDYLNEFSSNAPSVGKFTDGVFYLDTIKPSTTIPTADRPHDDHSKR